MLRLKRSNKGAVELSKVDDIDGTKLEGAVFNIVDMKGTVIHKNLVTNSKGKSKSMTYVR